MQRESEAADRVPGSSPRGELKASLEKQRKEAIDAILAAPGTFLRVYIEGQVKFWAAPGGGDLLFFFAGDTAAERIRFAVDADAAIAGKGIIGRQLVYMKLYPALFWSGVFCGLVLLFYLTFFVAGVSVASRDGNRAALVVFALLMYFPLTFFDTGNPARFRLPVMPLVAVFAGYGLTEGLRRFVPRMSAAREHDSSASV
jgi:hypothetical protein